jgi:hypothetical protein
LINDEKILELKAKFIDLNPIFISTYSGNGIENLKKEILKNF